MPTATLLDPVRFLPLLERISPDEPAVIQELIESLLKISHATYEDSGHAMRSVHAKSHGLLRGELHVPGDLPPQLAQGLFARAGTYPVVLRISTSPGDVLDDKVSTPRGMALKVFKVPGPRLYGAESLSTQDFLMVNGPAFLTPDVHGFNRSLKLLAATTDRVEGAKLVLAAALRGMERVVEKVGGESPMLKALGGHPLTNPLGETYFTQVPFLHGDFMAKYSLAPSSPALVALTDALVDLDNKPNGLRQAVSAFFASQGGQWSLRAQLCTDIKAMPIEDASVIWPSLQSPHQEVARLIVPAQITATDEETALAEDALFFSPWHGLAAHRPLGSINRARQHAYEASGRFRAERNGVNDHHGQQRVCPMARAS